MSPKLLLLLLNVLLLALTRPIFADDKPCNDIRATDFLLGQWRSQDENRVITESWRQIDQFNHDGRGVTKKTGEIDAPFVESLRIVEMSGEIFYLAKTPQNEFPVAFRLVACSDGVITFENSHHDFPNILQYQLLSATSLLARVSGNDGKGFEIRFELESPDNDIAATQPDPPRDGCRQD